MTALHPAPPAPWAADSPPRTRSRKDARTRLLAGLALWAGLLAVTYWWVAGGGVQDLGTSASGLTSLGRLTGLLAADLMLVQVLLMARLPFLESAFGQDRLARVHRLVGFTSFNLMLAHIVLITWGYAAGRFSATPATFWTLVTDYPGMLLALAGSGCLVLVVATSIRSARARLRYESWHLLHLYAYLGAGLALPHQLWTGQEFLTSTAATVYWWTLWAAALAAVLVFRVGLPAVAQPPARATRHLRRPRGTRRGVGVPHRSPPRPAPGRVRSVLHLALPHRPWVEPRQPLLGLSRSGRTQPAHHRQGPRRR